MDSWLSLAVLSHLMSSTLYSYGRSPKYMFLLLADRTQDEKNTRIKMART